MKSEMTIKWHRKAMKNIGGESRWRSVEMAKIIIERRKYEISMAKEESHIESWQHEKAYIRKPAASQ
jgi:hypothetical protein